ncbi:class I SAM-dependent methyltransferase [Pseudochrobactrum asaccharolyticum]|uniref:class I SAM-dependent methyltransferase n=1 Tax=Pseudochrobactrum asaccharolyticum TaxID=354351 RepID=UPI004041DD77
MENKAQNFSSSDYWENRYRTGGNSGSGSYGRLAQFKGDFLNSFFSENGVKSVLEFGCGDGNQLKYMTPERYVGLDVSPAIVEKCQAAYSDNPKYDFYSIDDKPDLKKFDVTLSLDVIYHLIENEILSKYIEDLFAHSSRYVVIYSSNFDAPWPAVHVKHRNISKFIAENIKGWSLRCIVPNAFPYKADDVDNTSFSDFLIYSKAGCPCIVKCPEGC